MRSVLERQLQDRRGVTPRLPGEGLSSEIDLMLGVCDSSHMHTLSEAKRLAEHLSDEDRAGLAAHLLASFRAPPLGPDDAELARREREIDSGEVSLLNQVEFLRAMGR